ncbi:hypothetical protein ANME2D_01213 [Candidatus Methanoperedens nitroreducens]|uniref:DUF6249 domain-containing protein n=1 Tax=Candidatus Methanoperedens nitratireducens TaxID=1392998 RepID=A0A062VAM1_9EURY|nr:DUF6249 domain-containing protein [Candidatus Methanoperedens nitroreducens]KCZ72779.1 hypothetical protein ANME2D_01213 [Candidatus Methanoperedens nitroreducens]MDJ1423291.1 hypothetical protein [Candidatus Methanoperedens sp.]
MSELLVNLLALSIPLAGVGIAALAIYLDYKKKMAMIEKGLVPEEEEYRPESRLGWGIAILGIGISLIISWIFNLDNRVMAGLILASIGVALLVTYLVARK